MSTRTAEPKPICPSQRSLTNAPVARIHSTAGAKPATSAAPSSASPPGSSRRSVATSGAVHRIPADSPAEPPSRPAFSSTTTLAPSSAARAAAARPAIPPPTTSRSQAAEEPLAEIDFTRRPA